MYLSRFMRVSRFLVTIALCFLFLAGVGRVSFCLAELAIELLLVGSAFFGCVAFFIAPEASFFAGALCALVLSPKPTVGVD